MMENEKSQEKKGTPNDSTEQELYYWIKIQITDAFEENTCNSLSFISYQELKEKKILHLNFQYPAASVCRKIVLWGTILCVEICLVCGIFKREVVYLWSNVCVMVYNTHKHTKRTTQFHHSVKGDTLNQSQTKIHVQTKKTAPNHFEYESKVQDKSGGEGINHLIPSNRTISCERNKTHKSQHARCSV